MRTPARAEGCLDSTGALEVGRERRVLISLILYQPCVYCRARDRVGQPQLQRATLGTMNLFILISPPFTLLTPRRTFPFREPIQGLAVEGLSAAKIFSSTQSSGEKSRHIRCVR